MIYGLCQTYLIIRYLQNFNSIILHLFSSKVVNTIPTIGFNVESVQYKNISFTVWDIGGQNKIRRLWHHYFDGNNGVIFVVDSNDVSRVSEAREELQDILKEERLKGAALLVFANKQDLPNAMSASELTEKLGLEFTSGKWYVQPCCATTKTGLFEGLDWLHQAIY